MGRHFSKVGGHEGPSNKKVRAPPGSDAYESGSSDLEGPVTEAYRHWPERQTDRPTDRIGKTITHSA